MKVSEYEYISDLRWLNARRGYLTASAIAKLLPEYKRVKAGKVAAEKATAFLALALDQLQVPTDDMVESRGAAARGHVMEPYAVADYNKWLRYLRGNGFETIGELPTDVEFRCVDDLVIVDDLTELGWSPDGCDIWPQYLEGCKCPEEKCQVKHGLEIKSYTLEQTMKHLVGGWENVDERWQCACALATVKTLESMSLMFYMPQIKSFESHVYDRVDLESEIEDVYAMAKIWRICKEEVAHRYADMCSTNRVATDEGIIQTIYLKQRAEEMMRG